MFDRAGLRARRGKGGRDLVAATKSEAFLLTNEERKAALEAIIYAADEPATIEQLRKALGEEKAAVQGSLDELVASHAAEEHGLELRAVAGGYKMDRSVQQHEAI